MGINRIPVQGVAPSLLTSQTGGEAAPLLNAAFETNPMDGLCDQRVKLTTRPVEICYDAVSAVLILSPCKEIVSVILPCLCQNTLFLVAEYNQQSGGILQAARIGSLETVSCLKLTNTLGSSEFSLWGGGGSVDASPSNKGKGETQLLVLSGCTMISQLLLFQTAGSSDGQV